MSHGTGHAETELLLDTMHALDRRTEDADPDFREIRERLADMNLFELRLFTTALSALHGLASEARDDATITAQREGVEQRWDLKIHIPVGTRTDDREWLHSGVSLALPAAPAVGSLVHDGGKAYKVLAVNDAWKTLEVAAPRTWKLVVCNPRSGDYVQVDKVDLHQEPHVGLLLGEDAVTRRIYVALPDYALYRVDAIREDYGVSVLVVAPIPARRA
jgi:hypothetical protein